MSTELPQPYTILVVDDEVDNLELLERTLRREYKVVTARGGAEGLALLAEFDVDLIMTDQRMPGITGLQLLERASSVSPHALGIILTGYTDAQDLMEAINSGYVYRYITKPWEPEELRLTLKRALETRALKGENRRLVRQLRNNHFRVLSTLVTALEAKDPYSAGHSQRVKELALALGEYMGFEGTMLETLGEGALLHDIGDIGVREEVLNKPGKLTDDEFVHVRSHVGIGADILRFVEDFAPLIQIVELHHERLDGTGYPFGLAGEQIPMPARIVAVADTFDALVSDRPHRPGLARSRAVVILDQGRGTEFDNTVVTALFEILATDSRWTASADYPPVQATL